MDALPDAYEGQYYGNVICAIFVARRISAHQVWLHPCYSLHACRREPGRVGRLLQKNSGNYHKAAGTFHKIAIYNSGGISLLSKFDVKIVPLDQGPIRHNIPDSNAGTNHFHELKMILLQPDQLYLSHGTTATQLESKYNRRH